MESAAVSDCRVALGPRVRDRRSRAAIAVGNPGYRPDPAAVSGWPRARVAAGGPRRGGTGGGQPVHDLVLAGGPRVHAPRGAVHRLDGVLRPGVAVGLLAGGGVVGSAVSAGAVDPVLRGIPDRRRGSSARLPA